MSEKFSVWNNKKYVSIFFVSFFVVILVDQVSKSLAVLFLSQEDVPVSFLGSFLQFYLVYNQGAAFSVGGSFSYIFAFIPIIFFIVVFCCLKYLGSLWWTIALGLILGGAWGNMFDRWFRGDSFPNRVVDFLKFFDLFVFNLADLAVFVGVAIIFFLYFRGKTFTGK